MAKDLTGKLREALGRFHAQDLAGAERLCGEILARAPNHPEALHLRGVMRLMGGNAREAVSLLRKAVKGRPDRQGARGQPARCGDAGEPGRGAPRCAGC